MVSDTAHIFKESLYVIESTPESSALTCTDSFEFSVVPQSPATISQQTSVKLRLS